MIFTVVAYRKSRRSNHNFNIIKPILLKQIYICDNSKLVLDFVRDIFQQSFTVLYSNNLSVIIYADINSTTLRVGKTAYLFQILIPPGFFPLYILLFSHIFLHLLIRIFIGHKFQNIINFTVKNTAQ